jgi:hypothetical protein
VEVALRESQELPEQLRPGPRALHLQMVPVWLLQEHPLAVQQGLMPGRRQPPQPQREGLLVLQASLRLEQRQEGLRQQDAPGQVALTQQLQREAERSPGRPAACWRSPEQKVERRYWPAGEEEGRCGEEQELLPEPEPRSQQQEPTQQLGVG